MSTKALIFSLILMALAFGGINHLVSTPKEKNPVESHSPSTEPARAPASVEHKVLASEVNQIISSHPGMIDSGPRGETVLGVRLDRPEEVAFLMTPEGKAKFFSQFNGAQNFEPVVQEVEKAWEESSEDDLNRREALLEMSSGLLNFTKNERLKKKILGEFDRFGKPEQKPEVRDYAARALQEYLDHESDLAKRDEELEKRGIPILSGLPVKTNN